MLLFRPVGQISGIKSFAPGHFNELICTRSFCFFVLFAIYALSQKRAKEHMDICSFCFVSFPKRTKEQMRVTIADLLLFCSLALYKTPPHPYDTGYGRAQCRGSASRSSGWMVPVRSGCPWRRRVSTRSSLSRIRASTCWRRTATWVAIWRATSNGKWRGKELQDAQAKVEELQFEQQM